MNFEYCLIVFNSTHAAMAAEKALKGSFEITIMPTLREISQSCGMSVRFLPGDYDAVKAFLPGSPVPEGSYTIYGVARVDGKVIPQQLYPELA